MLIVIRTVGILLLLLAIAKLAALVFIDMDTLIRSTAVVVKYFLMAIAGIGFILTRKWGGFVYLGSLVINWINDFIVYGGQGSVGPLWLSVPIPIAPGVLSYFSWSRLR